MQPLLFALILSLGAPVLAHASGQIDFAAEAEHRMGLSFDLDEVEEMLAAPARAMARPHAAPVGSYPVVPMALPLEPNSVLDRVTVFQDRAVITRILKGQVDAGSASLTFEGLPLGLAPDSLHAGVRAGEARIVGVDLESGYGEVDETERIESIREEMLQLTDDLGAIRDRIESLLAQRTYLRSAVLGGPGDGASAVPLAQVRSTITYVGEAEADIAKQLREEEKNAQELGEDLFPLLIKLKNPLATGKRVRVDLDADTTGEVTVALIYQVFGASWTPSYNARLDVESSQIELEYYGVVTQGTGEDWEEAELFLSTANPSASGAIPAIQAWFLGRNAQYGTGVVSDLAYSGYYEEPGHDTGRAQRGPMPEGVIESHMSADVQGSGAVVFAIPGRRTVAGDGSSQRLPVGTQTFGAAMELTTIPKMVPSVFRRARIRYDGEIPLIPGPVASYVGSDYVGAGYIQAIVPGETLELSFGTDERLKVTRHLASREVEYIGPGKRTMRYTFDFRITVANYTEETQVVELADQLPVSELDKVTVRVIELTEGRVEEESDIPGVLEWNLEIAPGEEQTVAIRFSVTAPVEHASPRLKREMEMMY